MIDPQGFVLTHAASLFWLMVKVALILLFASAGGAVPVYQGY